MAYLVGTLLRCTCICVCIGRYRVLQTPLGNAANKGHKDVRPGGTVNPLHTNCNKNGGKVENVKNCQRKHLKMKVIFTFKVVCLQWGLFFVCFFFFFFCNCDNYGDLTVATPLFQWCFVFVSKQQSEDMAATRCPVP